MDEKIILEADDSDLRRKLGEANQKLSGVEQSADSAVKGIGEAATRAGNVVLTMTSTTTRSIERVIRQARKELEAFGGSAADRLRARQAAAQKFVGGDPKALQEVTTIYDQLIQKQRQADEAGQLKRAIAASRQATVEAGRFEAAVIRSNQAQARALELADKRIQKLREEAQAAKQTPRESIEAARQRELSSLGRAATPERTAAINEAFDQKILQQREQQQRRLAESSSQANQAEIARIRAVNIERQKELATIDAKIEKLRREGELARAATPVQRAQVQGRQTITDLQAGGASPEQIARAQQEVEARTNAARRAQMLAMAQEASRQNQAELTRIRRVAAEREATSRREQEASRRTAEAIEREIRALERKVQLSRASVSQRSGLQAQFAAQDIGARAGGSLDPAQIARVTAAYQQMGAEGVAAQTSLAASAFGLAARFGLVFSGAEALRFAMKDLLLGSTLYAARVEQLGIALNAVSRANGVSEATAAALEQRIKKVGITTEETRLALSRMIASGIDSNRAEELARMAQNLGRVAGIPSSDALERLVHAVVTLQPELFRFLGLNVSLEQAYKRWVRTWNDTHPEAKKTVEDLSELEKRHIAVNEALRMGRAYNDVYAKGLQSAGGQILSFDRYIKEARKSFGEQFLPELTRGVSILNTLGKSAEEAGEKMGILVGWIARVSFAPLTIPEKVVRDNRERIQGLFRPGGNVDKDLRELGEKIREPFRSIGTDPKRGGSVRDWIPAGMEGFLNQMEAEAQRVQGQINEANKRAAEKASQQLEQARGFRRTQEEQELDSFARIDQIRRDYQEKFAGNAQALAEIERGLLAMRRKEEQKLQDQALSAASKYFQELIKGRREAANEQIRIEAEAAERIIEIQRESARVSSDADIARIDASKERQLAALDQVSRRSLEQTVALESRRAEVEQRAILETNRIRLRAMNEEMQRRIALARPDEVGALQELANQEFRAIQERQARDVEEIRRKASDRIEQLIIDRQQRIFESLKRNAEGVVDALITKSESLGDALKNILKTALLTPVKEIVSSQIAAALTGGLTGSRPQFQNNNPVGGGTMGRIGAALSTAGMGVPVFAPPRVTVPEVTDMASGEVEVRQGPMIPLVGAMRRSVDAQDENTAAVKRLTDVMGQKAASNNSSPITSRLPELVEQFKSEQEIDFAPMFQRLGGLVASQQSAAVLPGFTGTPADDTVQRSISGQLTGLIDRIGSLFGGIVAPRRVDAPVVQQAVTGRQESAPLAAAMRKNTDTQKENTSALKRLTEMLMTGQQPLPFGIGLGQGFGATGTEPFLGGGATGRGGWLSGLGPGGTSGFSGPLGGFGGSSSGPTAGAQTGWRSMLPSWDGIRGGLRTLGNVGMKTAALPGFAGTVADDAVQRSISGQLGFPTPTQGVAQGARGVGGVAGGLMLAGGTTLAMAGWQRGGWSGAGMMAGGGALIGAKFGGPLGAAIGAGVGFSIGAIKQIFFKKREDKIRERIKSLYGVDVDKSFVNRTLWPMIQQQFGGNIDVGIRSQPVREMIELYAMSMGQESAGIVKRMTSLSVSSSGGRMSEVNNFVNGRQSASTLSTGFMGGLSRPMATPAQAATPTAVAPRAESAAVTPPVINVTVSGVQLQLDGKSAGSFLDGRMVQTIQSNPASVAVAQGAAAKQSIDRRKNAALQMSPGMITA